jgi:pimeloyl-ACP methyl ester carboxylesterase
VYPRFETRGDLQAAVVAFCAWLTQLVQDKQTKSDKEVLVVLSGHSMGGLLGADAILHFESLPSMSRPCIVGLVAYDTPYLGLHPSLIHRTVANVSTRASQLAQDAGLVATAAASLLPAIPAAKAFAGSRWSSWAAGGVLAAAAAATLGGAMYLGKEKLVEMSTWVSEHLEFAGALWKEDECKQRLASMIDLRPDFTFHCYYTAVNQPATAFIKLPPPEYTSHFTPVPCAAPDEIKAHTSMFVPSLDASYYKLGEWTVLLINKMLKKHLIHK